jgi:hypothetical protein
MVPEIRPGSQQSIGAIELQAFDAIGYDVQTGNLLVNPGGEFGMAGWRSTLAKSINQDGTFPYTVSPFDGRYCQKLCSGRVNKSGVSC